jgi:hypothetical protein
MVFVARGVDDFPVSGIGKGVVGSLVFIAVGWYLFSPFVDKEGLVIFGLKTVFVALLDAAFCNCETGNGDCVNDGRTTVVVTGLCPLGLITEAGGLEV